VQWTRARAHNFPSGSVDACSRKTLGGHGENTFPLNTIHPRQGLGDGYGKISEIDCDAAFYGDCHRHRHRDVGDGRGDPRKMTPSSAASGRLPRHTSKGTVGTGEALADVARNLKPWER
jgi:hypothetical protein